jgi:hypothetical protein
MPIDVKARVSALIDEAGRIEGESESVYLELGRIFPRLEAEMKRGADNSARSFKSLEALGGLDADAGRGRAEAGDSSFVKEAIRFFGSLRERDSYFLGRINEGISHLDALEQIIARVRADSEEMEIISLNAMTVALKSGTAGKAFSVITDELKRLSGRTIALTEGVTANGRALLDFFAKLRNALAELDGFQRGFFATIDTTLGSGYEEIERELSGATDFFSTLLDEARSVREPVLRVMGEVQLQDIVRQSLQHVGLSLEEARDVAGSADPAENAFIAAVAELTGSLIEDVIGKLDASKRSFGKDMDAVSSIVAESERKRLRYLKAEAVVASGADSKAFKAESERYLGLKRDVVTMASRLSEHVAGLEGSFKGLVAILSRFQNIVVASRIEVAKTKALESVSTTVGGMITLTDRIEIDVNEAIGTTKDFTNVASEAIGSYSVDDMADEKLGATLREVETGMARLTQEKDSLRRSINEFPLYTDDFIELIDSARAELAKLEGLTERLRSVGESLRELKSSIQESIGSVSEGLESEKLRKMVERFTIFTHKKAAGAIGRFAVEEGGEAGEVTLF